MVQWSSFSLRNVTNLVLFNFDIICFAEVDWFVVVLVVVFVLSALVNDKVLFMFLHESERPSLVFVGGGDRGRREGRDLTQGVIVSVARTHRAPECLLLGQPLLDLSPVDSVLQSCLPLVELGLTVIVVTVQHGHFKLQAVAASVPLGWHHIAVTHNMELVVQLPRVALIRAGAEGREAGGEAHNTTVELALLGWLHLLQSTDQSWR